MYETIRTRLETIRNLPICELNQRQTMLVALIADIVNYETDKASASVYLMVRLYGRPCNE